ncbi:hypothetical protein CH333_06245 [candidate division WOR-3 bacterium JGI_Cruoil_03_44_89]|uniref:Uncharacterized protein n=1 Tax=candidate division WOR-3 bacterium JGI_Cruoil_03_44_89 TaxID=1973748 RepID=A0A235BUJ4_UNCW3|nr:MAG: hypothetical protein CH333_06245 [candidate division WOR-3 bacterium JGI_Cruoil_03_44_89]
MDKIMIALFISISSVGLPGKGMKIEVDRDEGIPAVTRGNDREAIPRMINFQGFLTDATGDTALTGTYDMEFAIYNALSGGDVLWGETQSGISVDNGVFNVILGENNAIPDSVFLNYTDLYLELKVSNQTLSPRQKIVSVGRSYKSMFADTSDYAGSSVYADSAGVTGYSFDSYHALYSDTAQYTLGGGSTSWADSAGHADVADSSVVSDNTHSVEGQSLSDLDSRFINAQTPDTLMGSGTTLLRLNNTDGDNVLEVSGTASSMSAAYGVKSTVGNSGPGLTYAVFGHATASSAQAHGVRGYAVNTGTGTSYGGSFSTSSGGTGVHYGVSAMGYASSGSNTYGVYGFGKNTGSGSVYGGYFKADTSGTGLHYGLYVESDSFAIYARTNSPLGGYAGYFDGNVRVASNVTSDEFYRGTVNPDSALMTKKYINDEILSAVRHAPTIVISRSPDSTGDFVCDGANDELEIQTALDSINGVGGGVVYVRRGVYNLNTGVQVRSNCVLTGAGAGTVINGPGAGETIFANGDSMVTIENLKVTGGVVGISFFDVWKSKIKQCWVENGDAAGIKLVGSGGLASSHYNVVAHSICDNYGVGQYCIHICGYENVIDGNNVRNASSAGIYLNGEKMSTIVENVINQSSGNAIKVEGYSINNTLVGNTCKGGIHLSESVKNTLVGNSCYWGGIYLQNSNENTVVGNLCELDQSSPGIHLDLSNRNTVSGNVCTSNPYGMVIGGQDNSVTGNVCSNNINVGIYINGSFNAVNDNRCIGNATNGINLAANATENIVWSNMLRGNGQTNYIDSGINTRDDDAGATGGSGGRCSAGAANFE